MSRPESDIMRMLRSRTVKDARIARRNNRRAMRQADAEELTVRQSLDELLTRWIAVTGR